MSRYIAFLRAINVGGRAVKMDRLAGLFGSIGLERVVTFIASGNVLFDAPDDSDTAALEQRIEDLLAAELGFAVETFVRTPQELATIVAIEPFVAGDGEKIQIGMLREPPPGEVVAAVEALSNDYDELRLIGRELHWLTHGGISGSRIKPAALDRALGRPSTMRNRTTIVTLAERTAPNPERPTS